MYAISCDEIRAEDVTMGLVTESQHYRVRLAQIWFPEEEPVILLLLSLR